MPYSHQAILNVAADKLYLLPLQCNSALNCGLLFKTMRQVLDHFLFNLDIPLDIQRI
jgi:hypothetical protein